MVQEVEEAKIVETKPAQTSNIRLTRSYTSLVTLYYSTDCTLRSSLAVPYARQTLIAIYGMKQKGCRRMRPIGIHSHERMLFC